MTEKKKKWMPYDTEGETVSEATISYERPYTRNDEMYSWDGKIHLTESKNGVQVRSTVSWPNDHKDGRSKEGKKAAAEKIALLIVDWIDRNS